MMPALTPDFAVRSRAAVAPLALLVVVLAWPACGVAGTATVYRWVDANGITHLSSEQPPAGVKFERLAVAATAHKGVTRTAGNTTAGNRTSSHLAAASSPAQTARRNALISELQNRECVVALEKIDRLSHSGKPVEPAEFRRLEQTADRNCSHEPASRREQEEMAARLRVAKGDVCVDARNALADMLETGQRPKREQLKAQQEFIEAHCRAPVR